MACTIKRHILLALDLVFRYWVEYKLRSGDTTLNKRLDRIAEFDERSRAHSISQSIVHSDKRVQVWKEAVKLDQGKDGACVAFATTHAVSAAPVSPTAWATYEYAKHLYYECQRHDQWDGGAYPGAKPRYEGTSVLAGLQRAKARGIIDSYKWAFNLDDAIEGVLNVGPAITGFNWTTSMQRPDKDGFVKPTGKKIGGHATAVVGVNKILGYFIIQNSWGARWGIGGKCKITFEDFEKLMKNKGEVAFPINRKAPAL